MPKTKTYKQTVRREGRKQFVKGVGQQLKAGLEIAPLALSAGAAGHIISNAGSFSEVVKSGAKFIKEHPGGTVASLAGISGAGKAIVDKAKGTYNTIMGLAKWLFNHPEWYDRFQVVNVKLNYNYRTTNVINTINTVDPLYPQAVVINYQLNEPYDSVATETLRQTINANLLSLRRARGFGYSNYDAHQLANYMRNIRLVCAMLSEVGRMIKMFNNYDILNTKMPYSLFAAADPVYNTVSAVDNSYANLAGLKHEYVQLVRSARVNCMGSFPLLDRTIWLASNIFADTKGKKVIAYVPRLAGYDSMHDPTGGTSVEQAVYYTANGTASTINLLVSGSIPNRMQEIRRLIRDAFINDPIANQISSDLLYLYGDKAAALNEHFSYLINTIEEPLVYIHDEYLLSQLQNTHVIGYIKHDVNVGTTKSVGHVDHCVQFNASGVGVTYQDDVATTQYGYPYSYDTTAFDENFIANTTIDADNISMGMQVSMLRLQATIPAGCTYYQSLRLGGNNRSVVNFGIQGVAGGSIGFDKSENVTSIDVVTPSSNTSFDIKPIIFPGNSAMPLLMDSTNMTLFGETEDRYNLAHIVWGMADWMPRLLEPAVIGVDTSNNNIVYDDIKTLDPEVFLWDINNYAPYSIAEVEALDQDAVQSLYVWTWNGNSLTGPAVKTIAQSK